MDSVAVILKTVFSEPVFSPIRCPACGGGRGVLICKLNPRKYSDFVIELAGLCATTSENIALNCMSNSVFYCSRFKIQVFQVPTKNIKIFLLKG